MYNGSGILPFPGGRTVPEAFWSVSHIVACSRFRVLNTTLQRLSPIMRRRERVFGALAVLGSFIGGMGLILLSIFDTKRHPSLHRLFLLIFMIGVALSALFTIAEVLALFSS